MKGCGGALTVQSIAGVITFAIHTDNGFFSTIALPAHEAALLADHIDALCSAVYRDQQTHLIDLNDVAVREVAA